MPSTFAHGFYSHLTLTSYCNLTRGSIAATQLCRVCTTSKLQRAVDWLHTHHSSPPALPRGGNLSELFPFSGGGQSVSNPMAGMAGLNIGALPMNPALVAAALNQAGWSLMGNLQQGGGGGPTGAPGTEHGAFTTPTSFPATVTPGGGPGAPHAGVTTMASSAPQAPGNGSAGFLGWGASPPGIDVTLALQCIKCLRIRRRR